MDVNLDDISTNSLSYDHLKDLLLPDEHIDILNETLLPSHVFDRSIFNKDIGSSGCCPGDSGELYNRYLFTEKNIGDHRLWIYFFIPVLVIIYQIFLRESATVPGGWYDKLKKPPFILPINLFSLLGSLAIIINGYATYRAIVRTASPLKKESINIVFILLTLHAAMWTLTFFDHRDPGIALFIGLILIGTVLTQILLYRKIDCIATFLSFLTLLWLLYVVAINFQILELNPPLNQYPVFEDTDDS